MQAELNYDGRIELICGPMFSGKTTELLRRLRRHTVATRSCAVIKYNKDTRYTLESYIHTHDQEKLNAIECGPDLNDVKEVFASHQVIGIDEGHFFPNLSTVCEAYANQGKIIIVAALDATYLRQGFKPVMDLIPIAESVRKLHSVCMTCYQHAAFSVRTSSETQLEVIGGADKYAVRCRKCFFTAAK